MQTQANTPVVAIDPFTLMMNPQAVLEAMEGSSRLADLKRRVYRPLDKPLIPHRNTALAAELAAFDSAIDADTHEVDMDEPEGDAAAN